MNYPQSITSLSALFLTFSLLNHAHGSHDFYDFEEGNKPLSLECSESIQRFADNKTKPSEPSKTPYDHLKPSLTQSLWEDEPFIKQLAQKEQENINLPHGPSSLSSSQASDPMDSSDEEMMDVSPGKNIKIFNESDDLLKGEPLYSLIKEIFKEDDAEQGTDLRSSDGEDTLDSSHDGNTSEDRLQYDNL
jgi:hypothetical protein